jgi:tetratricopeptide (TPR) repeat protein
MERAPHSPLAPRYLADEVIRRGNATASLELYRRAVSLDPSSDVSSAALASNLLLVGQYAEAERWFLRAQELYPASSPPNGLLHYLLGMTRNRMGKYAEAEQSLRTAISIHPDFSQYHYELALALKGQGRVDEARQALRSELAIYPASQAAKQLLDQLGD